MTFYMNVDSSVQNRRSRRANLFMVASLEVGAHDLPVRLRNLSREGALVEGDRLPIEGSAIIFVKGDLRVKGRIAWARNNRAGIAFDMYLDPEAVLRHVPTPSPRPETRSSRPPLKPRGV